MAETVVTIDDVLVAALASPLTVSGDAGSVTQRSVDEIIKAANYLAATRGQGTGLRLTRLVPDGAVGAGRYGCCRFNSPYC